MKTVQGNLLDLADKGEFDFIIHGCNCMNTMGAGIAKQIRDRYPLAFEVDSMHYLTHSYPRKDHTINFSREGRMGVLLGNFSLAPIYADDAVLGDSPTFQIINAYTQILPGANFELSALAVILRKINLLFSGKKIGIPQIGAGIGGGNWEDILKVIETTLTDMDVTIVIYKEEKEK